MPDEMFTFVVVGTETHSVEYVYCSREEADRKFDQMVVKAENVICIAYYCASVGGLVNAWASS